MIYILMTKRDYEEVSRGEISSSFGRRDPNNYFEKSLKENHPNAYRRREEALDRQNELYEKYRYYRPSRVLGGRELEEAIEICSEMPSQCFSFKETLAELGFHSLYSPQDRLSSLKTSIERGGAVLALTGNSQRWGGGYTTISSKRNNTFDEVVISTATDIATTVGAAATGVVHGVLQLAKDGDIREAVDVMNSTREQVKAKLKYNVSDETQEVIDNNPVVKGVSYVASNTVGKAIEFAKENLPEDVVFYAGSALVTGIELMPGGGKARGILKNGDQFASKGQLKPNIKYTTGEFGYVYKTDSMGRIVEFKAEKLQLTERSIRLPHDANTPGKVKGDHAGHLAGDRFGGSPEIDNLVSQLQGVNLSSYKKIENEWAKAIREGKDVSVEVKITYSSNSMRPEGFGIKYDIDGIPTYLEISNN